MQLDVAFVINRARFCDVKAVSQKQLSIYRKSNSFSGLHFKTRGTSFPDADLSLIHFQAWNGQARGMDNFSRFSVLLFTLDNCAMNSFVFRLDLQNRIRICKRLHIPHFFSCNCRCPFGKLPHHHYIQLLKKGPSHERL